MSQQSWIGKEIGGRFTISELLGQGGMSAVYKANDPNLRRVVAIKLIHPHLSSDPQFVRRFEEEAAAVASLRHPNIIQVFDFNNDADTYYIVFEFIPGESLQAHLQRVSDDGRLVPYEQTIKIAASVADALDYAHQKGIVHRDVKAANVMLNVQGDAILMDFGLVKIVGGDSHTATGAVMGTARYMSPEQIKGQQVDGRSDIYSLGVLLYELAGGRPPFQADSALTLLMMHVNDPVPDLRQVRPGVPPDLITIINKALAKDRAGRFQTAGEMAAALRAVRMGAGAPGLVAGAAVAPAVVASQVNTVPDAPAPKPVQGQQQSEAKPVAPLRPQTSPASAPPPANGKTQSGKPPIAIMGAIAAVLLVIICIGAAAIIFGANLLGGDDNSDGATETAVAAVQETQEPAAPDPTEVLSVDPLPTESVATATIPPEPTLQATATLEPTPTTAASPTASPTVPPLPTNTPRGPYVWINSIVEQGAYYAVDYTPTGYTPALPGMHIHFFWNTVPPQNAGVGPTQESWIIYAGPNPFTEYSLDSRPPGASQMCALVANSDHTVRLDTGNCADLP